MVIYVNSTASYLLSTTKKYLHLHIVENEVNVASFVLVVNQ